MTPTEAPTMSNGHAAAAPVYVRFGPGSAQMVPLEWAERMLTELRNAEIAHRKTPRFTDLLAIAALDKPDS
jgi:hypothetical protein